MKKTLPLLFVLATTSVWAEGAKPAVKPDVPKGVSIELSGATDGIAKLAQDLKAAPVYQAAKCDEPAVAGDKLTIINCAKSDAKNDKGLKKFLAKNAPKAVKWKLVHGGGLPCPGTPGCMIMSCPPPLGPVMCCNTSTYKAC